MGVSEATQSRAAAAGRTRHSTGCGQGLTCGQGEGTGARVAFPGVFGQAAGDDVVEAGGNPGMQLATWPWGWSLEVARDDGFRAVAQVGRPSRQAFVKHTRQRVD